MRGWTIQDALELYDVHAWGAGFVSVNDQGRVEIRPRGNGGPGIDLYDLTLYLRGRGLHVPLLIRFSDILAARIRSLCECFGSAIADPNRHAHEELPMIMAGRGGGSITPGRFIRYPENTPLNNLWMSMLERFGTPAERIGDSTGNLGRLS